MSKLILVSFADKRYKGSLKRLERQTNSYPFDARYFLTEDDCLTKGYWKSLKPWLYRRGFGYWSWRPAIVKQIFTKMDNGDILFWMDAGLFWNDTPIANARFAEYVSKLNGEEDLLLFEQTTIEQEWTKGDVLQELGVYYNRDICESHQFYGGIFMVKKTQNTCQLFETLEDLYSIKKELITDKRSSVPNKLGFREHRHDQSIFSVLAKQVPHVTIPWTDIQPVNGDWESMKDYPIQGRRLKELDRPKIELLKNKMIRPWREVLCLYFKYIRNYEFLGGNYPW